MCNCGNTGVERTPNKRQHTNLTLEKKILWPHTPGFKLATFGSQARHFTNMLFWLLDMNIKNLLHCHWICQRENTIFFFLTLPHCLGKDMSSFFSYYLFLYFQGRTGETSEIRWSPYGLSPDCWHHLVLDRTFFKRWKVLRSCSSFPGVWHLHVKSL